MTARDPNNPYPVHSAEWTQANEKYAEEISKSTGQHPGCFPPGTPVLTEQGERPMGALVIGDEVLAVGRDGQLLPRRIRRVSSVARARLFTIYFAAGRAPLVTTAHHALCTARGWVRAARLRSGDRIRCVDEHANWTWGVVVRTDAAGPLEDVFNLIVEDDWNFVADGCLVHSFGYLRLLRTVWHDLGRIAEGFGRSELPLGAGPAVARSTNASTATSHREETIPRDPRVRPPARPRGTLPSAWS